MSGYIGNIPVPQATQTRQSFTATASQTTFATIGYTPNFVDVYMNGVHLLDGTDYTATNGSDIVLTTGAAAGDVIEVVAYSTYQVNSQNYTGGLTVDNDGATVLTVDRATSDGTIIDVQRGGTSTAVIGVSAGDDVYFAGATGSSKGIYFNANGLLPATTGGSASDGTVDIGENITRWKDLYLSGGVYLGGTGAANKLEDYEEGTFTPVWEGSTSNPSATYNIQQGFYTKIGKVVHVFLRMDNATYSGGSGELRIGGLPFLVSNQADYYPAMPVAYKFSFVTTGPDWARFNRNLSSVTLYADNNTSETQLNTGNVQASTNVIFSGSYETDS